MLMWSMSRILAEVLQGRIWCSVSEPFSKRMDLYKKEPLSSIYRHAEVLRASKEVYPLC
jgi:hypothetical protein